MSSGDLVRFMLTMCDDAATDVIYHRIGQAGVDAVLADLGLLRTRIIGCCEDLSGTVAADRGRESGWTGVDAELAAASP
ncbi:MAG TPA: serine hydrolase [Nocardioidaceae bacterium]|nr:serine hydrolase [Nocardioidaceae bacterium]